MAIPTGQRLGPYEILSAIGAGGMGEVYRARDTRLDRTVAIKILPGHLSDRPNLRERFEREAKTIASLNHPHICTLHDVGHQDGTDYLVMEYIEGETLAQRLKKGPLPLEQTLRYAIEIADALDKAHRKGITHRDLKPGNIMLTKSGAKLLDFGLAKLTGGDKPATPYTELPTEKDAITAEGAILGTLQYMAPEQVEGKDADARTDIFAFGVVVYEMITGKKAFEGSSQASLIAKILETDPPPISTLQPMTPPSLDRVVKRCLAKDPDERWQSARDICEQLRWIADSGSQSSVGPVKAAPAQKKWHRTLAWAAMGLFGCTTVGIAAWNLKPAPPRPVMRFAISLPPGQIVNTIRPAIAISPDGTRLVYAAGPNSAATQTQIYMRKIDGLEALSIPGTEGATAPFFSPDGHWLGFSQGGKLKKVSLDGGAPVSLSEVAVEGAFGASWSGQGTIALAPAAYGPLVQLSAAGGNEQPLTQLDKGEASHFAPEFLPGGKGLLFLTSSGPVNTVPNGTIAAQFLQTAERRDLLQVQGPTVPHYAASGHLVYAQGSNLMAAPFDRDRLAITGPAVPVIEGVQQYQYSISNTGSLVYVPGFVGARLLNLVWVDRKGVEQRLPAPPHNYVMPRVAPDGRRVAAGIEEAGQGQISVYDIGQDYLTNLTFEGTYNVDPVWTPDGKRIVFKGNHNRLFWQPADGSAGAEELTKSDLIANNIPGSFSPDGQTLVLGGVAPEETTISIWVLSVKDGKPQSFLHGPSTETSPRFSPDGRWIAYASNESGRFEIYVRPYPGPGGRWQISAEGGLEPVWNPKGRELFFRNGNKMMAVDVTTTPTFSSGKPKELFEGPYVPTPRSFPDYDVSPDGQRFLMLKVSEQVRGPAEINVILNWFEELKQEVPTGKK